MTFYLPLIIYQTIFINQAVFLILFGIKIPDTLLNKSVYLNNFLVFSCSNFLYQFMSFQILIVQLKNSNNPKLHWDY